MPNNDTLNYMIKVAVHELVHAFAYKINSKGKRIKLLDEGIATYLAGQMSEKRFATIVDDCKNGINHSIMDFCIYNGSEFSKINGYAYSYQIIEFLCNNFGKEKILYWLENPDEFIREMPSFEEMYKLELKNKILNSK